MTFVAVDHARQDFDALLRRAADGEEILITQDGEPVAKLVPMGVQSHARQQTGSDAPMNLDQLRAFRVKHVLGQDLTIRQLIEEGRRT